MIRQIVIGALLTALLSVGGGVVAAACPAGTIEHSGDVILLLGRPALLVETCVAELGGVYTFTYRLTNWSPGVLELCSLSVPGLGLFPTATTSGSPEWVGASEVASGCITWWSWKSDRFALGPGETIEMVLTVDVPGSIGTAEAVVSLCGGTWHTANVLIPSACPEGVSGYHVGCFCDGSGACYGTKLFEGEGNRINLLSGPDEEINGTCLPSWVRHGLTAVDDPDRYDFRLTIDGVAIPLVRTVFCAPGTDVGNALQSVLWHVQFPADFFAPGSYEVTGEWLELAADGSIASVFYSRTIELTMIECVPMYPIIGPALPDLTVRIDNLTCACGWTPQQRFECEIDVWVTVTNEGSGAADPCGVRVEANRKSAVRTVPELAAGASYSTRVRLTFEADPDDLSGKCPLEIRAIADYADVVEESGEENNTATACCEP